MTTVTVFTAERMQAIEDGTVVQGDIVGNNLILQKHDGSTYNAGVVKGSTGATGPTGPPGATSILVCTSTTRPSTPSNGLAIYEIDTGREWFWNGTAWRWVIGTGTSPYLADAFFGSTLVTNGGTTAYVIPLTTERYDRANALVAGVYTAPVAGRYKASLTCNFNVPGAAQATLISAVFNNVDRRLAQTYVRGASAGDTFALSGSAEANLAAGQTVYGTFLCNVAGSSINGDVNGVTTHGIFDLVGY